MDIKFDLKHFKAKEVKGLAGNLVVKLDRARELAKVPFIINSGYRTISENNKVGGVKNSSHLKGLAVDISAKNTKERAMIVFGLLSAGFQRVKIYKTHVHADIDKTKSFPYLEIE